MILGVFLLVLVVSGKDMSNRIGLLEIRPTPIESAYGSGEPYDEADLIAGVDYMENFDYTPYYGYIHIGSNYQSFQVVFDTASADTWVFSQDCQGPPCDSHNKYNWRSSTTHVTGGRFSATVKYQSGKVMGVTSKDTIYIADYNENSTFLEVNDVTGKFSSTKYQFSGVLGMSFPKDESASGSGVFLSMLHKSVTPPVFSFYCAKSMWGYEPEVILGQVDTGLFYDPMTWVNNDGDRYWQARMDLVSSHQDHKAVACTKGCYAMFDTSTNHILGPPIDIDYIYQQVIKARWNNHMRVFEVDCDAMNTLPPISFHFNEVSFSITSENYIMKVGGRCVGLFQGRNQMFDYPKWRLGSPFFKEVYCAFDAGNKRIGLAKVKKKTVPTTGEVSRTNDTFEKSAARRVSTRGRSIVFLLLACTTVLR